MTTWQDIGTEGNPAPIVTIPLADYERLLELVGLDDMLITCEVCGAWIDREDPACASTEDFHGCWKVATARPQDAHLCRSYRAVDMATSLPSPPSKEGE